MPGDDAPTVFVDLYQTRSVRGFLGRPQKWRWRAVAKNGRILASGEAFTNKDDALDSIDTLFGSRSDVWLRQEGESNQLLRMDHTA